MNNELLNKIEKAYESIRYLISKEEFNSIVNSIINSKDFSNETDDNILIAIKAELEKVKQKFIKDKKKMLDLTNYYIDSVLSEVKTYDDSVAAFEKLNSFFLKIGYRPYLEFILELLKNKKFSDMCAPIYEMHKQTIKRIEINNIFKNRLIYIALEAYYADKGIEESSEEETTVYSADKNVVLCASKQYNAEIGKIKLLSREEERKKAEAYKAGDIEARQDLIEANLRLVYRIASRNANNGEELADLIQEGNLGLIRAVDRFDPSKGFRLSTYATFFIRRYILVAKVTRRLIRVAASVANKIQKIDAVAFQLLNETLQEPTIEEIAAKLGMPPETVTKLRNVGQTPYSLNTPIGDDDMELMHFLSDDEATNEIERNLLSNERKTKVGEILEKCNLDQRETTVIKFSFGLGVPALKYEEIGVLLAQQEKRQKPYSKQYIEAIIIATKVKILESDYVDELVELLEEPKRGRQLMQKYNETKGRSKSEKIKCLRRLLNTV